jgi:SAM-dependent methyltransferase
VLRRAIAILKRNPALYRFIRHQLYGRARSFNRRKIFLDAYRNNIWDDLHSASGIGSSMLATETLRGALPTMLHELGIKSILDIPCGDFHWMQSVPLGSVHYIGADIVLPLIEQNKKAYAQDFLCLDLLSDRLPNVDAVFCRDCLVHLSLREIDRALGNIARAAPMYLMTTTYPGCADNIDTVAPYYRALNFQLAPFNWPAPVAMLQDYSPEQKNDQGKFLGVWKVGELPALMVR